MTSGSWKPATRGIGRSLSKACAASRLIVLTSVAALGVAACSSTVTKHGQHLRATDLQLIQPGMAEDEVRLALGTPATQSRTPDGTAYYYISSTMSKQAFFKPQEIDRNVVAVYFSPIGTVDRVANYGLKDGVIFDYVSNTTPPANSREDSFLQAMFRNLGKQNIGTLTGSDS